MRVVKKSFSGYVCEQRAQYPYGTLDGVTRYANGKPVWFGVPVVGVTPAQLCRDLRFNAADAMLERVVQAFEL